MSTVANVAGLAAVLFVTFAAMILVLSSDTFVRAWDWTHEHPIITGLVFSTVLATIIVVTSK